MRAFMLALALFPLLGCDSNTSREAQPAGSAGDDIGQSVPDTSDEGPDEISEAAPDTGTGEPDTFMPGGDPVAVKAPESWVADMARTPTAIHMTWQQDPATTVTFQWATTDTDTEAYVPRAWVVPAADVDAHGGAMRYDDDWVTEGTGLAYQMTLLGAVIDEKVWVVWTVEVTGLSPDTEYVYRVGHWDGFDEEAGTFTGANLSEAVRIRTGLTKGSREAFDFVMAGDSRGGTDEIRENIVRLRDYPARMWFFNGDMTDGGTQVEWNDWNDAMQPLLTRKVLMPVQGNHEIFADLYYHQNALPRASAPLPEDLVEHAWSIDYANVHFVGLDSNTNVAVQEQVEWLEADLAEASADPDIDWIIVMMHHAPYSASNHGSTKRVQEAWVPLFEEYGVDVVFSGHDHNYERTVPIREDAEVDLDDGVVYVVAGGFYAPGYANGNEWFTAVSHHGDLGNFVHLEVEGKTLDLTAWSGTGGPDVPGSTPLDTFTIQK